MSNIGNGTLEKTMLIENLKSVKSEREIRNMKVAGELADRGLWKIKEMLESEKNLTEREVAPAGDGRNVPAGRRYQIL